MSKDEILKKELDEKELENVSGGGICNFTCDPEWSNCTQIFQRSIKKPDGSFTNCAATVEDGSHCDRNDACYEQAIQYQFMKDCAKAWH